jgi:hypothetical protein
MGGPGAGEALVFCFDHRAEGVVTHCALLLEVVADFGKRGLVDGFVEQGAVRGGPFFGVSAERQPAWVRLQTRLRSLPKIGGAAGPAIGRRIIRHACPHRVEFDIAVAAQHIIFAVDQTRLVTTFPERAGASVAAIEQRHIVPPQPLHHLCDRTGCGRREQQMDMVVHQHIGVQLAAACMQRIFEQMQVAQSVAVIQKAGQAIVAPLHDVLRNTGKVDAGQSGHDNESGSEGLLRPSRSAAIACQPAAHPAVGK